MLGVARAFQNRQMVQYNPTKANEAWHLLGLLWPAYVDSRVGQQPNPVPSSVENRPCQSWSTSAEESCNSTPAAKAHPRLSLGREWVCRVLEDPAWRAVIDGDFQVSSRVCIYDQAGLGKSDPSQKLATHQSGRANRPCAIA